MTEEERPLTFDEYVRENAKRLADRLPPVDDDTAARWARVLGRTREPQSKAS